MVASGPRGTISGTAIVTYKENPMSNEFFIEKRPDGTFAVERPNSQRASAIENTQKAAIDRAQQIDSKATIHVARVRHTSKGHPDQFRKQ